MTELALIDPQTASAVALREYAVAVRDTFADSTHDELEAIEALLTAVSKRLRQIGAEKSEAERSRVLALQRAGELLGERLPGGRPKLSQDGESFSRAEQQRRYRERLGALRYAQCRDPQP